MYFKKHNLLVVFFFVFVTRFFLIEKNFEGEEEERIWKVVRRKNKNQGELKGGQKFYPRAERGGKEKRGREKFAKGWCETHRSSLLAR